ncbi:MULTISPECIES: hypothetical protein [Agrobacterium]|uniref:Uncharacterized protein n=1 Tax=Agrobacterium tumefaciens TaxID=358 RepID=A0AAE6BHV4_AGRTU|nr:MULTISPECIES: hypothetical protein [Agrobacterium]QCL76693.1 hypothetical protein CFBP5499_25295 [Agrobacterium tumefaciens]QCL82213.1 hypothetical protein CFBP5877_24545 [Agrobacterium tumefaciens]
MMWKVSGLEGIPTSWNGSFLVVDPVTEAISADPRKDVGVYNSNLLIFDLDKITDDVLVTASWQEAAGKRNRTAELHRLKYKQIIASIIGDADLTKRITEDWFILNTKQKIGEGEHYNAEMDYMMELYAAYGGDDLNEAAMIITNCLNNIKSNLVCLTRFEEAVKQFSPIYFRVLG